MRGDRNIVWLIVMLAIIAVVSILPVGTYFEIAVQSMWPETISWDAKNAFAKCEGAIAGDVPWPVSGAACAAMRLCANEAALTTEQYDELVAIIRKQPNCGDP